MATASFIVTTYGHVLLIFLRTILVVHVPVPQPQPRPVASFSVPNIACVVVATQVAYKREHAVKANVPQYKALPKSKAVLEHAVLLPTMPTIDIAF